MSWGINPNATEKEKIFADFCDGINGLNCVGELSYNAYSQVWDLGRRLADEEYRQGKTDERAKTLNEFMKKLKESELHFWKGTMFEHGECICETKAYTIGAISKMVEQMLMEVE